MQERREGICGVEAKRAEEAGKRGDARTLYEITRKLSGRFQNTCKPVRNEAGVSLRSKEEEMHRWREQFEAVLNHLNFFFNTEDIVSKQISPPV